MARKPTVRVQMADEVEDLPSPQEILTNLPDQEGRSDPHVTIEGTIVPTGVHIHADADGMTSYQSRIRIVEAWRYPGNFNNAPDFIDRNWAAYGGYDEDRKIEAGPCLRLPANTPTGEKLARKGDYVVRQEVSLAAGVEGDVEVDVWPAEQFERLFLPVKEKPFRPFNPPQSTTSTNLPPEVAPEGVGDKAAGGGLPLKADAAGGESPDPHPSTKGGG